MISEWDCKKELHSNRIYPQPYCLGHTNQASSQEYLPGISAKIYRYRAAFDQGEPNG